MSRTGLAVLLVALPIPASADEFPAVVFAVEAGPALRRMSVDRGDGWDSGFVSAITGNAAVDVGFTLPSGHGAALRGAILWNDLEHDDSYRMLAADLVYTHRFALGPSFFATGLVGPSLATTEASWGEYCYSDPGSLIGCGGGNYGTPPPENALDYEHDAAWGGVVGANVQLRGAVGIGAAVDYRLAFVTRPADTPVSAIHTIGLRARLAFSIGS